MEVNNSIYEIKNKLYLKKIGKYKGFPSTDAVISPTTVYRGAKKTGGKHIQEVRNGEIQGSSELRNASGELRNAYDGDTIRTTKYIDRYNEDDLLEETPRKKLRIEKIEERKMTPLPRRNYSRENP